MLLTAVLSINLITFFAAGPSNAASCLTGCYAMRTSESSCPADTQTCPGGISTRCCPSNLTCVEDSNAFSFAGSEDCRASLAEFPNCPSTDWSLWSTSDSNPDNAFCCDEGTFGVTIPIASNELGVVCRTFGATLGTSEATASMYSKTSCSQSSTSATQTPSSLLDTTLSSATPTQTAESPGSNTTSTPKSSAKISGGAIAGIVIGAILGVFAMSVVWCVFRKRSKRSLQHSAAGTQHPTVAQLDAWQVPYQDGKRVPQLAGTPVYEMEERGRAFGDSEGNA
ncbi:hypothetical protein K491DRAFT_17528 [Lophiostoma macrostomum CBS 122681]|uniref:Mid2 domain-containing protein n=1 Tax=Lophiostoma macrostomum CBS 122681 TaxID=1314788 RepID=A0A6A6TQE6_9PLEO|nr:hypothetical protein K491DRAFT_17528 [Lophiostoma macrostomum CBS 122681]